MDNQISIKKNSISANPCHVIIPILVSISVLPVLVILTICWIRVRNIMAREKRIKDWVKENKIIRQLNRAVKLSNEDILQGALI